MDRLKTLGTWVILVIAFWLFSNGIIYICLHRSNDNVNNNANNTQVVQTRK